MNSSVYSKFYLERVGFEINSKLKKELKNGISIIGRNHVFGVDIGFDSKNVSREHCAIKVSDDSVLLKDLGSANGTTINGIKRKDKVTLQEGDIVGIVGGFNTLSDIRRNFNCIVYRLQKYGNGNIQTFEIDDDDPIELSDDDNNDVICLSESDGEVDSKEEDDLAIHLSRMFNLEIKKELEDIDAMENELKQEPADYSDIDEFIVEGIVESSDIQATYSSHLKSDNVLGESGNLQSDCESNDSNDSDRTLYFPSVGQSNDQPNVSPIHTPNTSTSKRSQEHCNDKGTESKLEETVTKLNGNLKRKKGPEIIKAKPLKKRFKPKSENSSPNVKHKKKAKYENKNKNKKIAKDEKKENDENLKNIEPVQPKNSVTVKSKNPMKAKVKFTPCNRSNFLTDVTQAPVLPRYVKVKSRGKGMTDIERSAVESQQQFGKNVADSELTPVTPVELEEQIIKDMTSPQKIVQNGCKSASKVVENLSFQTPRHDHLMEIGNSSCEGVNFSRLWQDESMGVNIDGAQEQEEEDDEEEEDDDDDDDDDDDEDNDEERLVQYIMKLAPETGVVKLIETEPRPDNLKSILVSPGSVRTIEGSPKRRVTFKQSDFQVDPRHQIISKITSYDAAKSMNLDTFWKTVDTNVSAFVDTYEDYMDYRGTIVPLMMVELWKEIEIEYFHSLVYPFTTVTINDQNLEKRGDGQRMVFHCQGDSLYKSQSISDGHLVVAKFEYNGDNIEFVAFITTIAYSNKLAKQKIAYFTMETAGLKEMPLIKLKWLQIRPITVITNTLNAFYAIYNLKYSPLTHLVLNPLSGQTQSQSQYTTDIISYKGIDPLDNNQFKILNTLYKRCTKLTVPNISLLDGAAGTGKTHMMVNLALQLVCGDDLAKPLRILICTKTNGGIDDITAKLLKIRDRTCRNLQLVRFGFLEHMDSTVRQVSVQHLKETEQYNPETNNFDQLVQQKDTLALKICALSLDEDMEHTQELELLNIQLMKFDALLGRFEGLDKKKLRDVTTFILNSCDIICTTLGSIAKLQSYVRKVDVCIIDEATQCNEPLTILPFHFGMPSLVLAGDSQLLPATSFSPVVREMKYGSSLFARFQRLYLGKFGSPVFELNFQYRINEEIMKWPNHYFYKNCVIQHPLVRNNDTFPIVSYKLISLDFNRGNLESDSIMLVIKFLLELIDINLNTIGVVTTNYKQNSVMGNKLRENGYTFITTNSADSYIAEKDIIIIWISKEHGMASLGHPQTLNTSLTRAKKCLVICGTELTSYKKKPVWKLLLEDAINRKCLQRCKTLTAPKLHTFLKK